MKSLTNKRSRQEWAGVINSDWRKSIEGIIQSGRDLIAAKEELAYGEFGKMIKADLDFSTYTAQRLMSIARHPVIGNVAALQHLPPNYSVLGELSKIGEAELKWAQDRGLVDRKTSMRKATALANAIKGETDKPIGEGNLPSHLPKPEEARQIARATGKLVAASDGNVYTGATKEEGAEHAVKRQQTYGVIDAINTISDVGICPGQWLSGAADHQLHQFRIANLEAAIKWLEELKPAINERQGVIEHEKQKT